MHFEILRINNLKRAEQRKMREYKQSALANRISGSRLDAIFKITNPKKKKKLLTSKIKKFECRLIFGNYK